MAGRILLRAAGLLSAMTEIASAHGTASGAGGFYDGVLHPLTDPLHLLMLVAAGLFAGQRGGTRVVRALPAFMLAALVGLSLADPAIAPAVRSWLLPLSAATGLAVALSLKPPAWLATTVLAAAGLLLGLESPRASGVSPAIAASIAGGTLFALAAALCWVAVVAAAVIGDPVAPSAPAAEIAVDNAPVSLPRAIALRVAGSWTAAIALLTMASAGLRG